MWATAVNLNMKEYSKKSVDTIAAHPTDTTVAEVVNNRPSETVIEQVQHDAEVEVAPKCRRVSKRPTRHEE